MTPAVTRLVPTANYCPKCGSELYPRMNGWSDGFLSLVDRGHIQEAIDGNESLPESCHERLHAAVRRPLADFCLLDWWDNFDSATAVFDDLPESDVDVNGL